MSNVTQLPTPPPEGPPDAWQQLRDVGLTYRQYNWWVMAGLIKVDVPDPGSGNRRSVSADEVETVRIMFEFVKDGIMPRRARALAEELRAYGETTIGGYYINAGFHNVKRGDS